MMPEVKRSRVFRNYFVINLLLVVMIAVLGFKLYGVVTETSEKPAGPADKQAQAKDDTIKHVARMVNEASYNVISNQDLFRPTRSPAPKSEVKTEKVPDRNPPKLFGTIILDQLKTAILEDPSTKSTKNYRINDTVAGYVISDILEDKVVLMRDGEELEIKLRESKGVSNPKRTISNRATAPLRNQAVSPPARQRRPQRTRRAIPPRQTRPRTVEQPHTENVPEEVENLIEDLQELDQEQPPE